MWTAYRKRSHGRADCEKKIIRGLWPLVPSEKKKKKQDLIKRQQIAHTLFLCAF